MNAGELPSSGVSAGVHTRGKNGGAGYGCERGQHVAPALHGEVSAAPRVVESRLNTMVPDEPARLKTMVPDAPASLPMLPVITMVPESWSRDMSTDPWSTIVSEPPCEIMVPEVAERCVRGMRVVRG